MATAPSGIARAGTAGQTARAFAARGQAMSADMLDGEGAAGRSSNGGGRRPGERGAQEKKGMPLMLVIVVVMMILPIVLGAYIMLAPDTMWKPLYVRVEMEDVTPVAGVASPPGAAVAPTEHHMPQEQHRPALHPPTAVPIATVPPLQPPGPGVMYQLGSKIVNLADPGGLRYLQTSIVLELHPELNAYLAAQDAATGTATASSADSGGHGHGTDHGDTAAASTALDARRPIIDDAVMTTLSSKRYSDISTIKGKQALKEELIVAINKALGVPGVLNIYFTEFVVQ